MFTNSLESPITLDDMLCAFDAHEFLEQVEVFYEEDYLLVGHIH